jgi:predicted NUDIX family phosphoesterase
MNKEQILIVPVNYISLNDGFTGASLSTKASYSLYDSIGVYRPMYEIEKNICFIRISVFLLIENEKGHFLVCDLNDKSKKPCYELGLHSYIKSYSGNYNAIYNQLEYMTHKYFYDTKLDFKFVGNIRVLSNQNVKSIVGCIYHLKANESKFISDENEQFTYNWCNVNQLIQRYGKSTSWSKIIIDMIVDGSIEEFI